MYFMFYIKFNLGNFERINSGHSRRGALTQLSESRHVKGQRFKLRN